MKLIDYDSLTSNYESESIHSIKNSTQVQSIHTNENREYSRKDNRTEDLDNLDSNVLVSKLGNLMMGDLATINEQHSDKSHDSKYNSVQSNSEVGSENNSFIMYSTHNQYKTEYAIILNLDQKLIKLKMRRTEVRRFWINLQRGRLLRIYPLRRFNWLSGSTAVF